MLNATLLSVVVAGCVVDDSAGTGHLRQLFINSKTVHLTTLNRVSYGRHNITVPF